MKAGETAAEHKAGGLMRSAGVVSAMTLLSRISGLARDVGFSHWFGAGPVMDAFFVAFKIPNLLRRFFAEGAFSQAFVPMIAEYRAKSSADETKEFLDRIAGTLAGVLFLITACGVAAAPVLIYIFAPGFVDGDGRFELATDMLRLTFPYLFFISLTALAGGILNSYRRFAVPAFTPVLLNVVLIVFAGWIAPTFERPAIGLALGVFVAGLVQLLMQLPFLLKLGLMPIPVWGWAHAGVRRVLTLMLPVMFGSSVAQISILFDTLIASFLAAGSISWLYYADRLMEFPLGVFGIAVATVMLPNLSDAHTQKSPAQFSAMLDWALRLVLLIGLPAALGLILLAEPLLVSIFYSGAFTRIDVAMASTALIAYAFGLLGFILVKVLVTAYYSRQDTRTPVRIGVLTLVLNMMLNVLFVVGLVRVGFAAPHAGLAAATTTAALVNAALLLNGLLRGGIYRPSAGWPGFAGRIAASTVCMGVGVYWIRTLFGDWTELSLGGRVAALGACVATGVAVYGACCLASGLRPSSLGLRGQRPPATL
jgi:putative peptidoglycan lipid II flippase